MNAIKAAMKPSAKPTGKATAKKTSAKVLEFKGHPKVGSGKYIRTLLEKGRLSPEEIVSAVHKKFPTSKATVKDVYWQRNYLKNHQEAA